MSDDAPRRFKVIEGGPPPDQPEKGRKRYRARKRGEAELLTCWQCEADTGVSGSATLEVKLGRMIRDGKPEGGTRAIVCARCLTRGKWTILV